MSKFFQIIIGLALLVVAAFVGYGIVNALNNVTQPFATTNNAVATSVAMILPPSPTPLPNGASVVLSMKSLARLETAQFTIEKVVIKEQGQGALGALFGDRVIFVAHGDVIAGVDLSKLATGDAVVFPDGKAFITLPASQIFVTSIDNNKSYIVDRQTGLLTKGNVTLETQARQEAQKEIEKSAIEAGILTQAQKNSEFYLKQLLLSLGYKDVTFIRATATP